MNQVSNIQLTKPPSIATRKQQNSKDYSGKYAMPLPQIKKTNRSREEMNSELLAQANLDFSFDPYSESR